MARQEINIGGQANDGTGDSIREAFNKVNQNFSEIYAGGIGGTDLGPLENRVSEIENEYTISLNPDFSVSGITRIDNAVSINAVPFTEDSFVIKISSSNGELTGVKPFILDNGIVKLRPKDIVSTNNVQNRAITDAYNAETSFNQTGPGITATFYNTVTNIVCPAGSKLVTIGFGVSDLNTTTNYTSSTVVVPITNIYSIDTDGTYSVTASVTLTRADSVFQGFLTTTVLVLKR